jgi:hypothetical protein
MAAMTMLNNYSNYKIVYGNMNERKFRSGIEVRSSRPLLS